MKTPGSTDLKVSSTIISFFMYFAPVRVFFTINREVSFSHRGRSSGCKALGDSFSYRGRFLNSLSFWERVLGSLS